MNDVTLFRRLPNASVEDLINVVESGGVNRSCCGFSVTDCSAMNDLGFIFLFEDDVDNHVRIEKYFSSILAERRRQNLAFIALCFLKNKKVLLSSEVQMVIAEYEADSANLELVQVANQRLATE